MKTLKTWKNAKITTTFCNKFALPKHIPHKTVMESNSSWQETTRSLGQMSNDVLFKNDNCLSPIYFDGIS